MLSIEELQNKIAQSIRQLPVYQEPEGLYKPISYTLEQGGKRIRPLLALLSTQLFGGDPDKALPAATAIEIFHNFTLLHDDIIDQAPIRRGHDTVFKKWNINTAILSGDTMFAIAYGQLAKSDPAILPVLMREFTKTAIEVCEGQQFDIDFEESDLVDIDGYINMIRLKTAVLLAASLKIGAITAGASENDSTNIYSFGENLGIAFQLQDDLLDAYGDEAVFGKKNGGDIKSNKKTFLYLKALESASPEDAARLRLLYSKQMTGKDEKVKEVLDLFTRNNVEQKTDAAIRHYFSAANEYLGKIQVSSDRLEPLLRMTNGMLQRKF